MSTSQREATLTSPLPPGPREQPERRNWRGQVERDVRGYRMRRILALADGAALVAAFGAASAGRALHVGFFELSLQDLILLHVGVPFWLLIAHSFGLYHVGTRRVDHSVSEELGTLLLVTTLWSWLTLLGWAAFVGDEPPLERHTMWWAASIGLIALTRSGVRHWARGRSWYRQNALVVGVGQDARLLLELVDRHPEYGVDVVACVDPADGAEGVDVPGVPTFHGRPALMNAIETLAIDRVIVAWPGPPGERGQLIRQLVERAVHVDVVPQDFEVLGSQADLHQMEGVPLIRLPMVRLAASSLFLKRLMDLAIALPAAVVLSPVFLYCVIRIKLGSPGSVLFRQERVGRAGHTFTMIKFRSMESDADQRKAELAAMNMHGGGTDRGMFKIPQDPRVTPFGKWMRRYSLDELPQLINVIRGEMSLVGPRPLIVSEDGQVTGHYRRRLELTPGLTGLWQVLGRTHIPFGDMVRLDYLYVTNWSLSGDIKLLLRTIGPVLRGRGAY